MPFTLRTATPRSGERRKARRKSKPMVLRTPTPRSAEPRTPVRRARPKPSTLKGTPAPGPYSDSERARTRKAKHTKQYKRALRRTQQERDAREVLAFIRRTSEASDKKGRGLLATVTPTAVLKEVARTASPFGLASRIPGPVGELPRNAIRDAIDIPANVVPSTYATGKALYKLGGGDDDEAKELWKQFKEHDPIALAVQGKLGKAAEAAKEHPLGTALEISGGKALVGRSAGSAGRKLKVKAASTKREPRRLEGTNLREDRAYSPDVITKAGQVAREKQARRKARRLRDEADRQERQGGHDRAHELREKAAKRDPDRISRREIEQRVDERVQANEDIRRIHRARVTDKARRTVVRRGGATQSLLAQNIIRADKADLANYLRELQAAHDGLNQAGRVANRALQGEIKKALANKRLDLAKVDQAARQYRDVVAPLERKLTEIGVLDADQAAKAKLVPYAVRKMGAKHDGDRLTLNGKPLTAGEIRAHMATSGVNEQPAFVTQAPNMRGGKNFFISSHEPKGLTKARRTGEATRKGTFDAHPDTLVEGAARMQGLIDANDGFRGLVKEVGRREGKTLKTYSTRKDAMKVVNDLNAEPGSIGWRPVRINPLGGNKQQLQSLLDEVDAEHQIEAKPLLDALDAAARGEDGPGPWAVIPEAAADRLRAHLRVLGTGAGGKTAQLVNSAFRKTVLSTSTKWAAGNIIEAGTRSAVMRAGPRSYATGKRVARRLNKVDPKAAEEFSVRVIGGGHYSMAERAHNRRAAEQFFGTRLEKVARPLGALWRTPGPKHVAGLWRGWTSLVFDSTRKLESQFQTAMAGKAIRDTLLEDRTVKLSQTAIDEAARGLTGTDAQVALGRAVDRAYGQYSKWSPHERQAIALYTPFVAWSLNAVNFVYRVLPRDHPVLTSLLAASHNATEEWRHEHGLGKFIKGAVPDWLQGSIPLPGGGKLRASRYLPFGFFADPGGTIAGNLLPQYTGPLMALRGMDWKGTPIRDENGEEVKDDEKFVIAAHEFVKATVPVLGQVERVLGEGGSITKELNPFEPVKPKTKAKRKGGSNPLSSSSSSSSNPLSSGGASTANPLR